MRRTCAVALLLAQVAAANTIANVAAATTIAINVLQIRENLHRIRVAAKVAKKAGRKVVRKVSGK